MIHVTGPGDHSAIAPFCAQEILDVEVHNSMDPKCDLLHQLINSITVVLGECELLQDKACEDPDRRLSIIQQRAKDMAELIRQHRCPIPPPQKPGSVGLVGSIISIVRTLAG